MSDKDPKSPATTSLAYDCMLPSWSLMESLLGGTETMRAAGETFLPMHQEETNEGYNERLNSAVLYNETELTLENLCGKPFSEPMKLGEDIPGQIEDTVLDDVDLQGNALEVFARNWFREGIAKALCHVLVEFPRIKPPAEGETRTLDDDRKQGVRPYWVMIKPECLIFARADVINGVEVLQHVRIAETYVVQDGFADIVKRRIRVLEPGFVQLWEPVEKANAQKEEWALKDEWPTGLDFIPLVTYYSDRTGFMTGKPPLTDLAWLNVSHWQSTADQRHILTVARFPILACSGASADDSDPVVIGPNKVLYNEDPQGKFYYVEHTGSAIEAGRQDILDLEDQMSSFGGEFLRKKPGTETATARALDSSESSSDLSAMVVTFEDAIAQALAYTAIWMKLGDEGGTVELLKDYGGEKLDHDGMDLLKSLREKRDISRKALLNVCVLNGVLPEDFDADEDWEYLQEEISDVMGAAGFDLDPNAPPPLPGQTPAAPAPKPGEKKPPVDKPKAGKKPAVKSRFA